MSEPVTVLEKFGRSSTTNEHGMDHVRIGRYVDAQVKLLESHGLIVMASGSIALGKVLWDVQRHGQTLPDNQTLAMLGSAGSSQAWLTAFAKHGILAGQLLLSHRELKDPLEGPMLRSVLRHNLNFGIVTVGNENDAVSDEEVKAEVYGGDNDGLSVKVAIHADAKYLLLRTDVRGLLDDNGELLRWVDDRNITMAKNFAGIIEGHPPRNDIGSKVMAAYTASHLGIDAYICHADDPFEAVLAGDLGTHFPAIG